ncbi:MAG: hypothetical protein KF718_05310 [Polyangiaceae bacterium]|nr:hypothetical protein [Polyangiaceae bacterium]
MSEVAGLTLQGALEAFEAAADELERQIAPLDEDELTSVLEELTTVTEGWRSTADAMSAAGSSVLVELAEIRAQPDAESGPDPARLILTELAALESEAEGARSAIESAKAAAADAVALLTERALAVSTAAASLEQPGQRLGGDAIQRIEGAQQRVAEQTASTLASLTDECVTPARSNAVSCAESVATIAGDAVSAFERNRSRLDGDVERVLEGTEARSQRELQEVSEDASGTATRLVAAVATVSDALRTADESKALLLDAVGLVNGGAQTVIDLLRELDELFRSR